MAECLICEAIRSEKVKKIFEEEDVVVILHPNPAAEGHLVVLPKQHFAILEQVPDVISQKCFIAANKFSMVLFEALNAMGTNMIVANGVPAGQSWPHFAINIVPRRENDGLNFQWNPKQASDEQLAVVAASLESEVNKIIFEKSKEITAAAGIPLPAGEEKPKEAEKPVTVVKPESYLMKQLRRLP